MIRPATCKALLGGAAATAASVVFARTVSAKLGAKAVRPGELLAEAFGQRRAIGQAAYWFAGAALSPMIYANLGVDLFPGKPATRGLFWGASLWLVTQTAVAPALGRGFFSAKAGGAKAAATSLAGNLLYGALLGAIASRGDERRIIEARERWLGKAA